MNQFIEEEKIDPHPRSQSQIQESNPRNGNHIVRFMEIIEALPTEEIKDRYMTFLTNRLLSGNDRFLAELELKAEEEIQRYQTDPRQWNTPEQVHLQVDKTCYAYATATAIEATERRIHGRLPNFQKILRPIIQKHGIEGGSVACVLEEECSKRQLRFKQVDANKCASAVHSGRCVVASFYFDDDQWTDFSNFFRNPSTARGVLQKNDIRPRNQALKKSGHAVVIEGEENGAWKIKNSWGRGWADGGRFSVAKDAISLTFYDVFFYVKDLTYHDLDNYRKFRYEDMLVRMKRERIVPDRLDNGFFEGEIRGGQRNGRGLCISMDGDMYDGNFVDNKKQGKGLFCSLRTNEIYEGDFVNNMRHGKGVLIFQNGDRYEGDFVNDERTGKGIYSWANGGKYEGNFVGSKRTGTGLQFYADGTFYTGEWKDDKKHGKGILVEVNGERYNGEFVEDKRNGKGICFYNDGDKYEGHFVDNKRHGHGVYFYKNGSGFVGDWKNDVREGQGMFWSDDGTKYRGAFQDNKFHGQGTLIDPAGRRFKGNFLFGEYQRQP